MEHLLIILLLVICVLLLVYSSNKEGSVSNLLFATGTTGLFLLGSWTANLDKKELIDDLGTGKRKIIPEHVHLDEKGDTLSITYKVINTETQDR